MAHFRFPFFAKISLFAWMLPTCSPIGWTQPIQTPEAIIEIAVNIYEFRLSSDKQLGIFYEFNADDDDNDGIGDGDIKDSEVFLPGTENEADTPIRALNLTGKFANLDFGTIDFNLKMGIQNGRTTIISNPTILASDGEEASIVSGEEIPLTVLEVKGNQTKLKTETRSTGIKLHVTPRIFGQNYVMMNLEIESSEITRFDLFDRGGQERFELPVVSTRNIKTVVIIPSGQQLYIGGLYTNDTGDTIRKVPIAGDLPGLGFFLRGFNKRRNQTETVFQITPTIRPPGEGIASDDSIFQDLLQPDSQPSQSNVIEEITQPNTWQSEENLFPQDFPSPIPSTATETLSVPIRPPQQESTSSQPKLIEPTPEERKPIRFKGSKPHPNF